MKMFIVIIQYIINNIIWPSNKCEAYIENDNLVILVPGWKVWEVKFEEIEKITYTKKDDKYYIEINDDGLTCLASDSLLKELFVIANEYNIILVDEM